MFSPKTEVENTLYVCITALQGVSELFIDLDLGVSALLPIWVSARCVSKMLAHCLEEQV